MHILFLTDNFPPEVNAPASRTFEHCREWVAAGHKVTVVTCAPNFPGGKVFDGYRNRLWQRETMDGIDVIRVWSYITANEGFARRIADYVSYMMSAIIAALFVRSIDIIIGTSPQLFTTCAAYVVSCLKRIPFVFELRDLWPASIRVVGAMKNSMVLDWLEKLELFLYRKADLIVSVTHSFRDDLARRGVDISKTAVVTNGMDTDRFKPQCKDEELVERLGIRGKFVSGYIGTHGMAHGLETILEAADLVRMQEGGDRFHFLFLGDGAKKMGLINNAKTRKLDNVTFLSTVPKQDVVRYWSVLDAAIIHLKKDALFRSVIPSKLFECMGMGIPVLHGVEGESAIIVEGEGIGVTFEPENARSLVQRLCELSDDEPARDLYRANGLTAAPKFDRKLLAMKMLDCLQKTAAASKQDDLRATGNRSFIRNQ